MSPEQLDSIAALAQQSNDPAVLRANFPGLHFTCCSDDDIPSRAKAVHDNDSFSLYLVSAAGGHCLSLTDDLTIATGVVVACKSED